MMVYYQLVLDTILSCAETLILFQMYRAFLRRNSRPNKYYYLGLFSYFVFQLVTYAGRWPLFSAWIYYLLFTLLLACLFFADTLQIKILVTYLFVTLHYSCKLACSTFFMALKHADLPSVPSHLIQSPLSQIAACIVFILFTWLFIYFRSMRRHNKYNLYSAITYLAPAGILFIVIHQFYLRTAGQTAPFYLSESGILMCTSFA
ncbi:MAG: ATP-binding protein, partial [Hungatella hathewayi]|nr:ATP-binding protein [Hungatella hathewayi]